MKDGLARRDKASGVSFDDKPSLLRVQLERDRKGASRHTWVKEPREYLNLSQKARGRLPAARLIEFSLRLKCP
jgi:hypothetical protein